MCWCTNYKRIANIQTQGNLSGIYSTEYKENLAMFVIFQSSYLNTEKMFSI